MLELKTIKNVAIENIQFAKNSLILMKVRESERGGNIDTTVNYIEVCELKDTKELTILQTLLRFVLAEFQVSKGFETEYKDTNIKQRRIIQPFLNTNVLFRTDSNGTISRALISEINFNKTALNVRENHTICKCKPENLKAAIYQHSKAVLAQCSYISTVNHTAESILKMFENDTPKVTKQATNKANKADTPKVTITETPKTVGAVA